MPVTFFTQRFAALKDAEVETQLYPWSTEYYLFRRQGGESDKDFYVDFEVSNPPHHSRVTYVKMGEQSDAYGAPMFLYEDQADIQLDVDGKGRFQVPPDDNLFSIVVANTTDHAADRDSETTMSYRLSVHEGLTTTGIVVDQTPPATPELAIEKVDGDRVSLTWTAPGDNGHDGWASIYDLRYSTQTLTAETFASGTRIQSVVHPRMAGRQEHHWATDLPETQTLNAMLRVEDDAGNVAWSNVVTFETDVRDSTPPAAVEDIRVVARQPGGITFGWTAPGDDGHTGSADRYDIRWSNRPITDEWSFRRAWVLDGPDPSPAGETDSVFLGGVEGLTVYVAIRTTDEMDNLSPVSSTYRYDPSPLAPAMLLVY